MLRPLIAALVLSSSIASAQAPAAKPSPAPAQPAPAPTGPSPLKAIAERTQAELAKLPAAKPEDVRSPEAIVAALYDVISGPAGKERDWNRFRSLFYPGAQMIPVSRPKTGPALRALAFSPEDYIAGNAPHFATRAFFEKETHRQVSGFGDLVNVLSAYETYETPGGPAVMKGVNSLQLFFDGQRWWVLNITWLDEKSAGKPVPKDFARKE